MIRIVQAANYAVICLYHTYRDYLDTGSLSEAKNVEKNIEVSKQIHMPFISLLFGLNSGPKISEATEYFNKMENNSNFENSKHD